MGYKIHVGFRVGRLEVIARHELDKSSHSVRFLCRCDCGREVSVIGSNLTISKPSLSCGCLRWERIREKSIALASMVRVPEFSSEDLDGARTIQLSSGYIAIVDEADFEAVSVFVWSANVCKFKHHSNVYAYRTVNREKGHPTTLTMHEFLIGMKTQLDHRDGNGLNNRRRNLRPADHSQNGGNAKHRSGGTSKWRGVALDKRSRKWVAQICKNRVNRVIGRFADEADAALAYNFMAQELFGDFANFNTTEGI